MSLAVGDVQLTSIVDQRQRGWIPTYRQKAQDLAVAGLLDANDRHVVIVGVGGVQALVRGVERQGVRRRALGGSRGKRRGDALHYAALFGVDHHHAVVVGARDEQPPIRRKLHGIRVRTDGDRRRYLHGVGIDDAHGLAGPVGYVQPRAIGVQYHAIRVHLHGDALQ